MTDAICQVVRCFDDENITHVEGSVDPIRDIETINLELVLADEQSVDNRLSKLERKVKSKEKDALIEYAALKKIKAALSEAKPARSVELSEDEYNMVKSFALLTLKPMIYIANMSEEEIGDPSTNTYYQAVVDYAQNEGSDVVAICAKIEEELSSLDSEEKNSFLQELGIPESGLDRLIKASYHMLDLQTYFTAGEMEVHAWTFKRGTKAPQAAGIIHTDFEKGFIRAEVFNYDDMIAFGSEAGVKEAGKLRLEGKEYVVQDGDIMHFRFNV